MKYLYGPVKSRRLGNSLGVTLTPYKVCNFDCVYCQLGKTQDKTTYRKEYVDIEEVLAELKNLFSIPHLQPQNLDYITISGFGEPTLNSKIADFLQKIKEVSKVPIALLTNSSLLSHADVRKELLGADLISPSLDAVTDEIFQKIDRPQTQIKINDIIQGLAALRKEFKGKIWLEIMLLKGVNDDLRYIKKFKEAIEIIKPDKIHLNSPVRTTAEPDVLAVDKNKLEKIKEILGGNCEII